jgi:hypothetical protein
VVRVHQQTAHIFKMRSLLFYIRQWPWCSLHIGPIKLNVVQLIATTLLQTQISASIVFR